MRISKNPFVGGHETALAGSGRGHDQLIGRVAME